jgi:hypothetical protein
MGFQWVAHAAMSSGVDIHSLTTISVSVSIISMKASTTFAQSRAAMLL